MRLLKRIDFPHKTQKRVCYKNVIYLTPQYKSPKLSKKDWFLENRIKEFNKYLNKR